MLYRLLINSLLVTYLLLSSSFAFAVLNMELTHGVEGAIPIAVVPFSIEGTTPPEAIHRIIADDLYHSGHFKVYGQKEIKMFPKKAEEVSLNYFRHLGTDHLVLGQIHDMGHQRYQINFQLLDIFRGSGKDAIVLSQKVLVSALNLRKAAHHISDIVYRQLLGVRGIFSTELAYIVVQHEPGQLTRYHLEVSDQDGYHPRLLLDSPYPIMSPSWSPNGKQVAYVSFEHHRAAIYVQDVATGSRHLISQFPGINGAPSWSPDGKKLALVLSKAGSPNIYIMTIANHHLLALTKDWYINTEPVWAPDGQSLLFTSNRSGGPQIYQILLREPSKIMRVSYDGDYNARASFTSDSKQIALIHRVNGVYKIAMLNLKTGIIRVISHTEDDSLSPSVAPNGSMVLYDTRDHDRNVLAMVSTEGNVEVRLPARAGDAQDPSWSPFLS